MTGADVAAMITAAGGATAAILGGIALVRRKSDELTKTERAEAEECFERRRAAYRWVRILRDLLNDAGIPEPEGIDDDLGIGRTLAKSGRDAD
jgi:hypothetical protein